MLEGIITFCVKNRALVIIMTLFLVFGGVWAVLNIKLDAIPDLSDVQVIVFTEYPGQAPQVVEDQITYPLTTSMLAVPYAKVVRGYSFFGLSFVYIIFEDGTDLYWARSRVIEYLNYVSGQLPRGVNPQIGPDATGVGWVYEYTIENGWYCPDHPAHRQSVPEHREQLASTGKAVCPEDGKPLVRAEYDLSELRGIQDWFLRFELTSLAGVAEVAPLGGFKKQYQVTVDPNRLLAFGISLEHVRMAISNSNRDVGGRLVEMAENEFMVLGRGYLGAIADEEMAGIRARGESIGRARTSRVVKDLGRVAIGQGEGGTPIYLEQVAEIKAGPDLRRGVADRDGEGETVVGIVIMRFGENALRVIAGVRNRLQELEPSLPAGVVIRTAYDRSQLIERAVDHLKWTLMEEMLVVTLVIVLFLLHLRSSLVAAIVLPLGVLTSLLVMYMLDINANIMSLGGIAIAIGVMVDASVVMVENAHKHLERDGGRKSHEEIILAAAREVGPALFYSLIIITVSFLPVFALGGQSGRLFRPLAYTKTFAIAASAILAITVVPVLMYYFIRGKILPESRNPLTRISIRLYRPVIVRCLAHPWLVLASMLAIVVLTILPLRTIGSEFMPPLNEGDLLYMPTTDPGISITKARELAQQTDRIIRTFDEVHHVLGKVGRAETATDPAPLSMMETTIMLRPHEEWPQHDIVDPATGEKIAHRQWTQEELVAALDTAVDMPGLTNAWTMPIKTRIDMLSTGIKTPIGIKVLGPDLAVIADVAGRIASELGPLPGTLSIYPEKTVGGNYLEFTLDRDEIARYGLSVTQVENAIMSGIGGMTVTETVEGLERYSVNLRYPPELRDDLETLARVLVSTGSGAQVPLGTLAQLRVHKGPPAIKSENARLTGWIYVDIRDIDVGTYVARAQKVVEERVLSKIPPGYSLIWSGQFEYMQESAKTMRVVIPVTLVLVFLLLFLHFRTMSESLIVMVTLPFALVGGIWLMALLGYNSSVATQVGYIALAGLAAETGVVMLVYLRSAWAARLELGDATSADLDEAILEGSAQRVRPILMTVLTTLIGLLPVMLGSGTGSEVMRRLAAPMVGGLVTATGMTLIALPVMYRQVERIKLRRRQSDSKGQQIQDG